MHRLGIDLGGTKIEGIILDDRHQEIFRRRISTEQEKGYTHILDNINVLYGQMAAEIRNGEHTFGIGTPGAISPLTGLLKNSNTQCLNGQPLQQDLEHLLDRKIAIQNDANCFALAEAISGAAVGKDMVFGVIMGTGCGGGIVYKGEVLNGPQAIAGEWGHTAIDPEGPKCWCGSRGCVETLISGAGLERLFREQFGEKVDLETIIRQFRAQQEPPFGFINAFFENFGRALANLINVLDPDIVVLGGGLSNIDELYSEGIQQVERFVFSDSLQTPIKKNKLGDSAGVIGAALIGI